MKTREVGIAKTCIPLGWNTSNAHLEAKLEEAATQKWCLKLELCCSTLTVHLEEMATWPP